MKRGIYLSFFCASILYANETIKMDSIEVEGRIDTKIVKDVSGEQLRSADLAEALVKNVPSISIVKRSGIANDIILRGQKKDNINILIDGAKIYGACGGRMDPSITHVLTNNIESIKVIEGPYDVENFGTLSGSVEVKTKDPKEGINGEISLNGGSFGYKKASATLSGGTQDVKFLISASTEEGDQYEDGNGDNFYEQQIKAGVPVGNQYAPAYRDGKAFEKKTLLAKTIVNLTDNQEINLSYTANRNDNILYPAGTNDAIRDDSDLYTIGYEARQLGKFSEKLTADYYYSTVDHPMNSTLRNNPNSTTSHPNTSVWGARITNSLELSDYLLTLGLDTSKRNWTGESYDNATEALLSTYMDTNTTNKAIFSKLEKSFGKLDLEFGARYDNSDIDINVSNKTNKYVSFSANAFGIYNVNDSTKLFAGFGKASRVPDGAELGKNGNLKQTNNYELDLGFEKYIGDFSVKTKLFYSSLKDYIYRTDVANYNNIDATIYGVDVSGAYYATDEVSFDYGLAYLRGEKDDASIDKDLAEIPPLKLHLAFNYETNNSKFMTQLIAVDRWDKFDASAKEQELAGYAVVNLKYNYDFGNGFDVTLGLDNIFDKTYASTNTYQDVPFFAVGEEKVIFNDVGRYGYLNIRYSF